MKIALVFILGLGSLGTECFGQRRGVGTRLDDIIASWVRSARDESGAETSLNTPSDPSGEEDELSTEPEISPDVSGPSGALGVWWKLAGVREDDKYVERFFWFAEPKPGEDDSTGILMVLERVSEDPGKAVSPERPSRGRWTKTPSGYTGAYDNPEGAAVNINVSFDGSEGKIEGDLEGAMNFEKPGKISSRYAKTMLKVLKIPAE